MLACRRTCIRHSASSWRARLVAAYDKRGAHNPGLDDAGRAAARLERADGKGPGGAVPISLAYQHVRTAIAENAAPGKGADYDFRMAPAVVEKLLRERPAGWFADYDEMLLRALVDAVEEGTAHRRAATSSAGSTARILQITDHQSGDPSDSAGSASISISDRCP